MLKRLSLVVILLLTANPLWAAPVTYPGPVAVDDAGATVSPTSISVTSVTDLDGNAITSPSAVAHVAGPNVSVVYDAAAKGEAWITLTPVLAGHTFANNPPCIFASTDPQTLASVPSSVWGFAVDGSLSAKTALAGLFSGAFGKAVNTYNAGTHTLTTTYYKQDGSTAYIVNQTVYNNGAAAPSQVSRPTATVTP